NTRHIPVCVISTDDARERALGSGALTFVPKPIKTKDILDTLLEYLHGFASRQVKSLLVVEPDAARRERIIDVVDASDAQVTSVATTAAARQMLGGRRIDCLIVGDRPGLPPAALADDLQREPLTAQLPVIVYGEGKVIHDEDGGWKKLGEVCSVRRVHSAER